jgi:hypothetical protein
MLVICSYPMKNPRKSRGNPNSKPPQRSDGVPAPIGAALSNGVLQPLPDQGRAFFLVEGGRVWDRGGLTMGLGTVLGGTVGAGPLGRPRLHTLHQLAVSSSSPSLRAVRFGPCTMAKLLGLGIGRV